MRLWSALLIVVIAACSRSEQEPKPQPPKTSAISERALSSSHPDPNITVEEVKKRLREPREDYLYNTISWLIIRRDDPQIMELLKTVWARDKSGYPDLAWSELGSPVVRVALAQTLAQVYPKNQSYKAYILKALDDRDPFVQSRAALALGVLGDPTDIPKLETMVRAADKHASEMAIVALASMRRSDANAALERLKKEFAADVAKVQAIEKHLSIFRDR